ncbi:hypothetical protein SAMN03097708_01883 [Thiohalomonas denitrificans]|uniref:Uncharacterized protein n=1 Tax=Thiohalomonas denitrificans TaxID=415747 RepID=A0A1G5QCN4_9GAMM|nr:hypothetical protein SAMN03097708_01883 [Thiohalomonas denitrificans]
MFGDYTENPRGELSVPVHARCRYLGRGTFELQGNRMPLSIKSRDGTVYRQELNSGMDCPNTHMPGNGLHTMGLP